MEEFIDDLEKEKDHLEKIIKVVCLLYTSPIF